MKGIGYLKHVKVIKFLYIIRGCIMGIIQYSQQYLSTISEYKLKPLLNIYYKLLREITKLIHRLKHYNGYRQWVL